MIDNPLTYVLIEPNVVSPEGLKEIVEHAKSSPEQDLSVFDADETNKSGETKWRVDRKTRDTQIIEFGPLFPKIEQLFREAVKNVINPFYNVEVSSSEVPQLLSYGIGGHYKPHIDGESIWVTPKGEKIWKKSTDRDLSTVLFLNDDFEGGDFIFPDFNVRVRPKPGMMVCFPSNHHYTHGVEPVTRGHRYSIVTWSTVKGFKSMEQINKDLSDQYGVPVV
jgi:predicted 2-oxoglutarate/Fe(II)-dependent dioxygenase YbiX